MIFALKFAPWEGIQLYIVDGCENTLLNVGVRLFQFPQQLFHLLPLTGPNAIFRRIPRFRKPASTLQKVQLVKLLPGYNRILVNTV